VKRFNTKKQKAKIRKKEQKLFFVFVYQFLQLLLPILSAS